MPPSALATAAAAILAADPDRALLLLLDAWRAAPVPSLADPIATLGDRVALDRPPIAGKRAKDRLAAWTARAREADPRDLSLLLATLTVGNSPEALVRLLALADWPPDPRIGRALAAWVAQPPFQAQSTKPFWKELFAQLPARADAAALPLLEAARGTMRARLGGAEGMADHLEKQLAKALDAIVQRRGAQAVPTLDEVIATGLAEVSRALDATRPDPRALARKAIDAVDWGKLEDAYGPAHEVRTQLHSIAGDDEAPRRKALDWAWSNLSHQSSVYSASAAAAPILVTLVGADDQPDRAWLLWLLTCLALGDPSYWSVGGGQQRDEADSGDARDPISACWTSVKAGASTFLRLVDDPDPRVRTPAAMLCGLLVEHAEAAAAKLRRRLDPTSAGGAEPDEGARATQLVALAFCNRYRKNAADLALFKAALEASSPLVRGAASIAIALVLGDRIDARALDVLRATTMLAEVDSAFYPWSEGNIGGHARAVEASLALQSPAELLAQLREDLADPARRPAAEERAWRLVGLVFGETLAPLPLRLPEELDEVQRGVVEAFIALGSGGLQHRGLFFGADTLRRFLGLTAPGPLDTRVDVMVDGKVAAKAGDGAPSRRSVPIWWAFGHAVGGLIDPQALVAALGVVPAETIVAAWREIVDSGYELWRTRAPVAASDTQAAQAHLDAVTRLLTQMSLAAGSTGRAAAEALATEQLELPPTWPNGNKRFKNALACACATHALQAHDARAGRALDPRWDPLVAETIRAAPAWQTPAITEAILAALEPARAAAIVLGAAALYRIGRIEERRGEVQRSWPTISFDGTLRYLRLVDAASGAARVIEAIEAWARVCDETPKDGLKPPPLPKDELLAFLARVGAPARPRLEASLAKNHRAKKVVQEALRRLDAGA